MITFRTYLIALVISVLPTTIPAWAGTDISTHEIESAKRAVAELVKKGGEFTVLASIKYEVDTKLGKLIVWSLANPTGSSDTLYTVGAVVVQGDVTGVLELTRYLSTYVEEPGKFYRVASNVNALSTEPKASLIHVHIYSILSGSGGISGATDLILRVGMESQLTLIKDFGQTGTFARLNVSQRSYTNTKLYSISSGGSFEGLADEVSSQGSVSVKGKKCYWSRNNFAAEDCSRQSKNHIRTLLERSFDNYLKLGLVTNAEDAQTRPPVTQ